MAYTDLEFYFESYYGDTLTADNGAKFLSLASDELDALTRGRLRKAFPDDEYAAEKVKKAVCDVADALYLVDVQRKAVQAQKAEDGTYHGAVASVSSGRESVSYSSGGSFGSVYSAAASSAAECRKLIADIAVKYLANVSDKNGINFLYSGV